MQKTAITMFLILSALPGWSQTWPRPDWTEQRHPYSLRNGWMEQLGPSVRFDDHGNGLVAPDSSHPWHSPTWSTYDRDGNGSLDPGEFSRMRVDLRDVPELQPRQ